MASMNLGDAKLTITPVVDKLAEKLFIDKLQKSVKKGMEPLKNIHKTMGKFFDNSKKMAQGLGNIAVGLNSAANLFSMAIEAAQKDLKTTSSIADQSSEIVDMAKGLGINTATFLANIQGVQAGGMSDPVEYLNLLKQIVGGMSKGIEGFTFDPKDVTMFDKLNSLMTMLAAEKDIAARTELAGQIFDEGDVVEGLKLAEAWAKLPENMKNIDPEKVGQLGTALELGKAATVGRSQREFQLMLDQILHAATQQGQQGTLFETMVKVEEENAKIQLEHYKKVTPDKLLNTMALIQTIERTLNFMSESISSILTFVMQFAGIDAESKRQVKLSMPEAMAEAEKRGWRSETYTDSSSGYPMSKVRWIDPEGKEHASPYQVILKQMQSEMENETLK